MVVRCSIVQFLTLITFLILVAQQANAKSCEKKFNTKALANKLYNEYVNDPFHCEEMNIYAYEKYNNEFNMPFWPPPKPTGLIHEAHPPGHDVIMGIAFYSRFKGGFQKFVGSLRHANYTGHIIIGINPDLPSNEIDFLKRMDVTLYSVQASDCDPSIAGQETKGAIRGKCSVGLENLKLEWGRFEMARRWLYHCEKCTGWAMVADIRDTFFQSHPFSMLGNPKTSPMNLLFIEEISPYSSPTDDITRSFVCDNFRNRAHTVPCYGKDAYEMYGERPVLCSGTVIGNNIGMIRFLNVLVAEFYRNNRKSNTKCQSPVTTDQWIMNYLYYHGKFGDYDHTVTIPWGLGPVLTAGKACMTADRKPGASDLLLRSSQSSDSDDVKKKAWFLNYHDRQVSPVVHQYDRCAEIATDFFNGHLDVYNVDFKTAAVPWYKP